MLREIEQLHDLLLDHRNADLDEIIHFVENKIAEFKPFNHESEELSEACRINLQRNNIPNLDLGKLSLQVETLEQNFSKRDIAFMFAMLYKQITLIKEFENKKINQ